MKNQGQQTAKHVSAAVRNESYRTLLLVMSFRHVVHSRCYEQWQQPRSRAQVTPAFLFSAGLLFALPQLSVQRWGGCPLGGGAALAANECD